MFTIVNKSVMISLLGGDYMSIKYNGLFHLLSQKGISKTQLKNKLGFSSTTLAKLSKNEPVSMKIIEDICRLLHCQPGDIMEMEKEKQMNNLLLTLNEEKEMKLKGGIYHQTQIKLSYNSNRIEGSRLSEDQTRYIYETNTVEMENNEPTSIDDIMETVNHFQCFDYMIEHAEDLISEAIIKEFHKILKNNTSDSKKEGDSKTTAPSKVKNEMAKLLEEYNGKLITTFEDIIDFHHRIESIHPFQDGNGRVGRMIMFKECLKNNMAPFIIEETHKIFYYRGLKEYSNEKGCLMDTCLSAQDRYKELMRYFTEME